VESRSGPTLGGSLPACGPPRPSPEVSRHLTAPTPGRTVSSTSGSPEGHLCVAQLENTCAESFHSSTRPCFPNSTGSNSQRQTSASLFPAPTFSTRSPHSHRNSEGAVAVWACSVPEQVLMESIKKKKKALYYAVSLSCAYRLTEQVADIPELPTGCVVPLSESPWDQFPPYFTPSPSPLQPPSSGPCPLWGWSDTNRTGMGDVG
jgi:hypothetical protein